MRGKICATLGPSCCGVETLRAMFRAGMQGIRLNLSHGTLAQNMPWVEAYREAARLENVEKAELIIDMQGPELRIGTLDAAKYFPTGETVALADCVPLPEILLENLRVGDELLVDDGALSFAVESISPLRCRVLRGGMLKSRKSIAVVGRELPTEAVTAQDRENLRLAARCGVTGVMQPFVRGGEDLAALRRAMTDAGAGDLAIFAKIENRTGMEKLHEIIAGSDVVVIARGDLGNAMPLWELPRAQAEISRRCREAGRSFMVSTQMLHSMHHSAVPTRAEVTDVYTAAKSGADYLLLTGETAAGEYPVDAVEWLTRLGNAGWEDAER